MFKHNLRTTVDRAATVACILKLDTYEHTYLFVRSSVLNLWYDCKQIIRCEPRFHVIASVNIFYSHYFVEVMILLKRP